MSSAVPVIDESIDLSHQTKILKLWRVLKSSAVWNTINCYSRWSWDGNIFDVILINPVRVMKFHDYVDCWSLNYHHTSHCEWFVMNLFLKANLLSIHFWEKTLLDNQQVYMRFCLNFLEILCWRTFFEHDWFFSRNSN